MRQIEEFIIHRFPNAGSNYAAMKNIGINLYFSSAIIMDLEREDH